MTLDPLPVHKHFRCDRKEFEGPEEHCNKPAEVRVNPKVDWDDFADAEQLQELLQPRIDSAKSRAAAWERYLIRECLRMGVWRVWFVQWCEFTETAAFMNTDVFAPWDIRAAQALAKKVGAHIVGLNLKRWLLYTNSEFNHLAGTSTNKDLMIEMRRVMRGRCIAKCMKSLLRYRAQAAENAKFKADNPETFKGMVVAKGYWTAFDKISHKE